MARIDVFFLGGTIGMARETGPETGSGEAAGAPSGGAVPRLSGGDLLADLDLPHGTSVIPHDTLKVGSSRITFAHLARVLAEAREAVDAGATGIVVVQGTDTMEETSYLLDLLWGAPEPLVVTGAMRNPGLAGIDGPANLAQAITLAADPVARDLGVLVVMADEVHADTTAESLSALRPAFSREGTITAGSASGWRDATGSAYGCRACRRCPPLCWPTSSRDHACLSSWRRSTMTRIGSRA